MCLCIYLGNTYSIEGLWLQLLSDVRNRVCYNHGPPVKCVLHSLWGETHHDLTLHCWKPWKHSTQLNPPPHPSPTPTHLEQLNQSTQCFDRGLGHGPLHRHVHVHGGFDDDADAVCIQDALWGENMEGTVSEVIVQILNVNIHTTFYIILYDQFIMKSAWFFLW